MSLVGCRVDEISTITDIGQRMSPVGGRPDVARRWSYRDPRYLLSGEAWVERDTICYHFPGSNVGRKSCHPIYRNPKGSPDARNEYIEVGRISINFFSPK